MAASLALIQSRSLPLLTADEVEEELKKYELSLEQRVALIIQEAISISSFPSSQRHNILKVTQENGKPWTETDNQRLLELCGPSGTPTKEIALEMHRTLNACKERVRLLRSEDKWTPQQIAILVEMVKNRASNAELWREVSDKVSICDRYCSWKAARLGLEVSFNSWSTTEILLCERFAERRLVKGQRNWDSPLAKELLKLRSKDVILKRLAWLERRGGEV